MMLLEITAANSQERKDRPGEFSFRRPHSRQIDDASRRFQRMNEFSQEVGKIVKIVEDLARRTI